MSNDDGGSAGRVEWLGDDGSSEELLPGGRGPGRWPRWVPFVGLLALAGLIAGILISEHGSNRPVAAPTSSTATSSSHLPPVIPEFSGIPTVLPSSPTPLGTPSPPLTTRKTFHADLGISAVYELFARGPGVVERIQFADGGVTATPVPAVLSTGPVSFVVGAHAALVRPVDLVPGYLVPDHGSAVRLTGALSNGGPIFPGPDPTHVWVEADRSNSLILVDFHGHPTPTSIKLPEGARPVAPDGSGYVIVDGANGIYDARPSGITRITTGSLLAAGPTGWLVRECDQNAHCTAVYVDRTSGQRRTLAADVSPTDAQGIIAPDGRFVALPESVGGSSTLHLIDLFSGADRVLGLRLPSGYGISQMAWSPDSSWLFVAGDHLRAVYVKTGHIYELNVQPTTVTFSQIAVRRATNSS